MVNSVNGSSSTTNTAALSALGSQALGKDDFLKLLVAQLQNQDPLNPSDPTEFTAQLAQFSSLEQLFSVNDSLAQMAQANNSGQDLERLSAFSLIGRQVELPGPDFDYSGTPVGFSYSLDGDASAVTVRIVDADDHVVAVLPQASTVTGTHQYAWDGTKLNGDPAAVGAYHLEIERIDNGVASSVDSRLTGLVDGVELGSDGSVLTTTVGNHGLADILRVTGG